MKNKFTMSFKGLVGLVIMLAFAYHANAQTPPVAVCQDITVYVGGSCTRTITAAEVDNGSFDPDGSETPVLTLDNYGPFGVGVYTVTLTATDSNGSSTCMSQVTVLDNINPTITCGADISQTADPSVCQAAVTVPAPTTGDNCGVASVINDFNFTADASDTYPVGTTAVTWTVTDIHGNTATCTQNVTVTDDENPTYTPPTDVTQTADPGVCQASVTVPLITASDNCGIAFVTNNYNGTADASDTYPVGTTTITWTIADIHANLVVFTQNITVTDDENPTITCSADISQTADPGVCQAAVTVPAPSTGDNCGVTGVVNDFNGTADASDTYPVGTTTVTWTVTDIHGNMATCTQGITVSDDEAPTFTAPADITIYKDASCNYDADVSITGDVTDEADNCGVGEATYVDAVANGSCEGEEIITRTWSLVDIHGNAAADQVQVITAADNTPPTFTAPADITIYKDASCNYDADVSITGDVTDEADNCSTGINATFVDVVTPGSCEGEEIITRTWSLSDNCGNAASDQVQVITATDNTPPTFTAPADITIYKDASCNYDADVSITGDVTDEADNCSTGINATFVDVVTPGSCEGEEIITRTWSLTDNCGNAAADQDQIITVEDNTPPTFTVPADITIYRDENCNYDDSVSETGDVEDEADNCTADPQATYSDILDETDPCHVLITRTWSLMDDCGNTAEDQLQIITVVDNTPPTFTAPADITIYKDENCSYDADPAFTGDVTDEADNCGVGEAIYMDDIDDTDTCFVYITRTWSLVDDCGNVAADQVQYITVTDNTPPVAVCQNITIELDENGEAFIVPSDIDGGTTDNCGFHLSASQLTFDCSNVGENIVMLTATDYCSNMSSCDAIVTVEDNIPPEVTTVYTPIFLDEEGHATVTVDDIVESVWDNCGIADMFLSQTDFYCEDVGFNHIDLIVIDVNGNKTIVDITVGVFDQIAPTLEVQDVTVYLDENGQASIEEEDILVGTWDNCEVVSVVVEQTEFTCDDVGFNVVHVYIEDASGNEASDWAIVTVIDEIAPTLVCPDDIVVEVSEDLGVDYYIVQGDEFDPVEMNDNCFIETVSNSFNSASTLDGAQLPVGDNVITWTVEDQSGNLAECTFTVTVTIVTGVASHDLSNINIYPNPVNTTFRIDMGTTYDKVEIIMMDINGKVMMVKDYERTSTIELDGTTLPNGVYMIRISGDDQSGIFSIVKQ